MGEETVRTLVIALLSTGGATFIWTVVKSLIAYRDSAEGREDKAVARLERYEADCREQLRCERVWGAYWQRRSAILEYALIHAGVALPPLPPEPQETRGGDLRA